MKIVIVTSEVTFVKDNYNQFLKELFKNASSEVYALAVLKNNDPTLIMKGLGLYSMGAKKTGLQLIKNSLLAKKKDHESMANKFKIPTFYFKGANDPNFYEFVKDNEIDLIINARTRDIYKKKILKLPKLGCINVHHGLLPEHRGLMCDLYALYENRPAGFSVHKMESKIDAGKIIKVVPVTQPNSLNSQNFPEHIYQSSIIEGKIVAELIKTIKNIKKIPTDNENISDKIIHTTNPNQKLIRKMLKKGMIL